jgi:hypothetical protein
LNAFTGLVAVELVLSVRTVERHITNLYGLNDRSMLATCRTGGSTGS